MFNQILEVQALAISTTKPHFITIHLLSNHPLFPSLTNTLTGNPCLGFAVPLSV